MKIQKLISKKLKIESIEEAKDILQNYPSVEVPFEGLCLQIYIRSYWNEVIYIWRKENKFYRNIALLHCRDEISLDTAAEIMFKFKDNYIDCLINDDKTN